MSVGTDGATVLVVVGDRSRARDLAAGFEAKTDGVDAVTVTALDDALERLHSTEPDGVFAIPGTVEGDGRETLETLASATEAPLVIALRDEDEFSKRAAIDAGATDAVDAPRGDEELAVVANRLALAVRSARAEHVARETQQRYHRLLEASPAAILIYDSDGTIVYANHAATELSGAEDAHVLAGRDLFEFVAEESRGVVTDRFESVIEDREPVRAQEIAVEGLDGDRRYLESAGSPVSVDGDPGGQVVLTDVTEQKERERRLRTERDRFTTLFDSLPEPAVHVRYDGGEPIVRNVNPAFEDVFGYDADSIAGNSLNELVVPARYEAEAREIDLVVAEGTDVEREIRRTTADGEREFLFRAQAMSVTEEAGEGVGIYVDITERKRREEALERQNERLDVFASIVSHDLQSPLTVAKGNLSLARQDGEDEYLDNVGHAVDRMERMIEDLLRLARGGEQGVDVGPVEGSTVVTEAWTELDVVGGDLRNEWDREVMADRSQLRELLVNLFRNAVEHGSTCPGSQASEDASGGDCADVTIEVGPLDRGFYVADDGPGIPEAENDRVFEPGFTTHEDGTGFGLVVVQEIARAHGWTATLAEAETGGARFEFTGVEPVEDG